MINSHDDERIMIDPPSGWMYGFPKEWTGNTEDMLREARYPLEEIEWALQHCRFWTEVIPTGSR